MQFVKAFPTFLVHADDVRSWVIQAQDDAGKIWAINCYNVGDDPDWTSIDWRAKHRKPWSDVADPDVPFQAP